MQSSRGEHQVEPAMSRRGGRFAGTLVALAMLVPVRTLAASPCRGRFGKEMQRCKEAHPARRPARGSSHAARFSVETRDDDATAPAASDAPPSGRRPNYGVAAVGFSVFGVTYALTIAATGAACSPGYCERFLAYSAIPVAGPLIEATAPGHEAVYLPLQVAAFGLQLGGLTLGIAGLATTHSVSERSAALTLTPWVGPRATGASLTLIGL